MNMKKLLIGLGWIVGLALIAGVAYLALNLMTTGSYGLGQLQFPGLRAHLDNEKSKGSYEIVLAPELPQTQPGIVGAVVAVQDDTLTVQPQTDNSQDQSSPSSEVIITANTRLYHDLTIPLAETGSLPVTADGRLQQVIESFDADSIHVNDVLTVWGDERGDRLIAEVVLVMAK